MSSARPFRFAVQSFSAASALEWRERARRIEDLGYSALHLADHVLGPGEAMDGTNHPIQELAAVPAMAMAAEATSTLRIGCARSTTRWGFPSTSRGCASSAWERSWARCARTWARARSSSAAST